MTNLNRQPSRISIIYTTTDAINTYGFTIKREVRLELIKRFCSHCKLIAPIKRSLCMVNGQHKVIYDWVIEKTTIKTIKNSDQLLERIDNDFISKLDFDIKD